MHFLAKSFVVISLALLTSCAFIQNVKNLKPLAITFKSLSFKGISNNVVTANVILNIKNPNKIPLPPAKLTKVDFLSEGLKIAATTNVEVSAFSSEENKEVDFDLDLNLDDLNKSLQKINSQGSMPFEINGEVQFLGITQQFYTKDKISAPIIKLARVSFDSNQLSATNLVAVIEIDNQNNIVIPSQSIALDFYIYNRLVFSSNYNNPTPINPNENKEVKIELKINPQNWQKLFNNLVRNRGNLDYRVDINSSFVLISNNKTSYGTIQIPLNTLLNNPGWIDLLDL